MNKFVKYSLITLGVGGLCAYLPSYYNRNIAFAQADQSTQTNQAQTPKPVVKDSAIAPATKNMVKRRKAKELFEEYSVAGLNKIILYQIFGLIPLVIQRMNLQWKLPMGLALPIIGGSFVVDYFFYRQYLDKDIATPKNPMLNLASDIACFGFAFVTLGGMGLTVANYIGFLLGTYLYTYYCGDWYQKHISTVFGAVGSAAVSAPFWYYWLKNPTNRMLAIGWSLVTYAIYGYFFNRQFEYHLNVKEDKEGFSSFMLNTYKWATINLALFGYCTRVTDNVPLAMMTKMTKL